MENKKYCVTFKENEVVKTISVRATSPGEAQRKVIEYLEGKKRYDFKLLGTGIIEEITMEEYERRMKNK